MEKREIIVVGAGAGGLMAAITAARQGAQVTLLEGTSRCGRKLSQTGNGKCNFTNLSLTGNEYRSEDMTFPRQIIDAFPPESVISFFESIGILPKYRGSYVYPLSDQAGAVTEALYWELKRLGAELRYDCALQSLQANVGGTFLLGTAGGSFFAKAVILCMGSKAFPLTGSDGSGYRIASSLGLRVTPLAPALCGLRAGNACFAEMAGVRTEAKLQLEINGAVCAEEKGELQLTEYGISGIPVFQLSGRAGLALQAGKSVRVHIDFLPQIEEKRLETLLTERHDSMAVLPAERLLLGIMNDKLALALLRETGILPKQKDTKSSGKGKKADKDKKKNIVYSGKKAGELRGQELLQLARMIKHYPAEITESQPYETAQCVAGGVDTREVFPESCECRRIPGLYLAGELLDVDGDCGGYNLQFAWSSAYLAGRAAAERAAGKFSSEIRNS